MGFIHAIGGTRLIVAAAVLGPWLWLLGPVLVTPQSFVFRDAAHYYYPLFQWSAAEWGAGRIPLWDPQENLGVPVLADNTTSVFYPGKLVFALPLAYAARYELYIVGHVLLAAAFVYALARRWGADPLGAAIAAVSYAFGGNVLFQYCNVVFLVGAAWLPLALLLADRMLRDRRWTDALWLGAVLALMTLGGDPQMAYHAGLVAGLGAIVLWLSERRGAIALIQPRPVAPVAAEPTATSGAATLPTGFRRSTVRAHNRLSLLLLTGVTLVVLAAVQGLPSTRWTWHTQRAAYEWPRSLYEIPGFLARPAIPRAAARPHSTALALPETARPIGQIGRALLAPPQRGTHHASAFEFSVGPWRWPELLWPNLSGRQFPIHRRWIQIVPAEGRVWTPTLYMGLLPAVLGLASLRLGLRDLRRCLLSWIVVLATAGSLGIYGLGWLVHQIGFAVTGDANVPSWLGPQIGGLYWAMTWLLPGYVLFRYPAKLLVVASLGLSLLAALGWQQAWNEWAARMRATWLTLGIVSLLAAVAVMAGQAEIKAQFRTVTPDALFGPLDVDGAWRDLLTAFCHAAVVCGLLWLFWSGKLRCGRRIQQSLVVVLLAVELTVAQAWTVPRAPQALWQQCSAMAMAASQHSGDAGSRSLFRIFRASIRRWRPPVWRKVSSAQRQVEGLNWDRDTLFPRHHLATQWALVESNSGFVSADLEQLLAVARRQGPRRPDGILEPHRQVLDALASRYLILPDGLRYGGTVAVPVRQSGAAIDDARLWHNPHSQARAWIVHEVVQLPAPPRAGPTWTALRTQEVLFPHGQPRELAHCAVVEGDVPYWQSPATRVPGAGEPAASEHCRLVRAGPLRVELHVQLAHPGLVVLSDLLYPGWQARVQSRQGLDAAVRVPILRTNRVMRGVYLPPGAYRVVYVYRPWEFYIGAAISALGWTGLILGAVTVAWRRRANGIAADAEEKGGP